MTQLTIVHFHLAASRTIKRFKPRKRGIRNEGIPFPHNLNIVIHRPFKAANAHSFLLIAPSLPHPAPVANPSTTCQPSAGSSASLDVGHCSLAFDQLIAQLAFPVGEYQSGINPPSGQQFQAHSWSFVPFPSKAIRRPGVAIKQQAPFPQLLFLGRQFYGLCQVAAGKGKQQGSSPRR